jgi:hypothetical protein
MTIEFRAVDSTADQKTGFDEKVATLHARLSKLPRLEYNWQRLASCVAFDPEELKIRTE